MEDTIIERRARGPRIERTFKVRFAVNGGPEYFSNSINFTTRSLAIRSAAPVKAGDKVRAIVDFLPPLEGTVARVWKEGFAITLSDDSLALITLSRDATQDSPDEVPGDFDTLLKDGLRFERLTPMEASNASWFGIVSPDPFHQPERQQLLLVTTAPIEPEAVRSAWLTIGEMRCTTRILSARRKDDQTLILLRINNWQLQNAREAGLAVTLVMHTLKEWSAAASAAAIETHLMTRAANAA